MPRALLLGAASSLLALGLTPLAAAWASGARTVAAPLGDPGGGNQFHAVDCTALGTCVAVGEYAVENGAEALLEASSSGTWAQVTVPLPTGASTSAPSNDLGAATCTSATSCVAVGSYATSTGGQQALLVTETAGTWADVAVPLPADASTSEPSNDLDAVTCTSDTSCVAVGSYATSAGDEQALLVTETGGSWSDEVVPLPTDASAAAPNNDLTDVTCVAPSACVAVGSYVNTSGDEQALLVSGGASTWSDVVVPLPAGASTSDPSNYLDAVTCAATTSCEAVGSYADSSGDSQALLVDSTSGTWTATAMPLPADASATPSFNTLTSATCTSAGNCVAVGVYENQGSYQEALLDEETAGVWSTTTVPLPANADVTNPFDTLDAISCISVGNCVSTGFYSGARGFLYPNALLEVEVDGTWLVGQVQLPPDADTTLPYSSLTSVSCVSLLACVAVGLYSDLEGSTQALLDNLGVGLTSVPVVPDPPTGVSAASGHGQARVSWRVPASDGGSPITGYTATASPGGASCSTGGATACTIRPLKAGSSYSFSVAATSDLGSSLPSASTPPVSIRKVVDGTVTLSPFSEGSAALTPHLKSAIQALAAQVAAWGDTSVTLTGYDDDRSTPARSLAVSRARAAAVRAYLTTELVALGLDDVKVATAGRGDADPVASNKTAAGRTKNRRVVAAIS